MVFYFTATGNSLYIAKQLDHNLMSIPQVMKNENLSFSDETIGIVSPIFSGELPMIVQEFIKKSEINSQYIYMILTYGNDDTVAAGWSKEFAEKSGINVDYIATIKMVDNYLPVFDMSEQIKIDKNINNQLETIISHIKSQKYHVPKTNLKGKILYRMVKKMHTAHPEQINGQALVINEKCKGCGICVKVCPRGILQIENGKAIRTNDTCDFCLSCANNCPEKAIGFSSGEKNPKARYRNENITLNEIIESNNQR